MQMRAYAVEQASTLLVRLVFQISRAMKLPDADAVHDLRVAIRRFVLCLRVFDSFFPASQRKKIHRHLRVVLGQAAEVRNRDIALKLCTQAGLGTSASVIVELRRERERAQQRLIKRLERLRKRDFSRKWRKGLNL